MIEFKQVELSDKAWMDKLIHEEDSQSADFNFTNIYIWDGSFRQYVAEYGGRLLVKLTYPGYPFYSFPVGGGDLKPVVLALRDDAERNGVKLDIKGVTPGQITELEEAFPGRFEFSSDTPFFDYMYSAEKMATLSGKKLHAKRNHINRFVENNNWLAEPMSDDNLDECKAFTDEWMEEHECNVEDFPSESLSLLRTFDNFEFLGLEGVVLRVDGKLAAYSIGEKLNSDTFVVHFEKAISDTQGAYAMMNREFARAILENHPESVYINREDDMGMENLRRAKRSYYPEFMVEKYSAVWKD